jgi:hypothetical protein
MTIKYWVGVASKEHVDVGVKEGFCQVCHGKKAPLSRMKKGDKIIYYSPKKSLNSTVPYQKIVAVGTILDDIVYEYEMFPNFIPFRRNVLYEVNLEEVSLEILKNLPGWKDYRSKLRFGHFEISKEFFVAIYSLMKKGRP